MRQIVIPIVIVSLLLGLFLPLPVAVIDYLVVSNLTLALLLLLSVLFVEQPLKLSTLPSILLLATIFRLMTNIATTRQLLTTGTPGEIIPLVGQAVIQGSVVVGIVLFTIITLVQLIVISKGAERVAEVSARFTLDALPGKQMSIDADVRAGLIDFAEAKQKRNEIQIESKFYGSLDGAMKFIKGDAIVGILITIVNILGGLFTGIVQHGLSLQAAIQHYTLLTIGDGIISQFPAVLNSVAAGIIITRVVRVDNENLANELLNQLMESIPVKLIIASIAFIFSFTPGLPMWPFLLVGTSFLIVSLVQLSKNQQKNNSKIEIFYPEPLSLLSLECDQSSYEKFMTLDIWNKTRKELFEKTGLILPDLKIDIKDQSKLILKIRLTKILELDTNDNLEESQQIFFDALKENVLDIIDDRQTRKIIEQYEPIMTELIMHLIPEIISITQLTCLLKSLLKEEISLRNMDLILQAVAENQEHIAKPRDLLQVVRIALKQQISEQYSEDNLIQAYTISPLIDFNFYESEISGKEFKTEHLSLLIENIEDIKNFVLVCSKGARQIIKDCLRQYNLQIPVLAYEEINKNIKIKSVKHIEVEENSV